MTREEIGGRVRAFIEQLGDSHEFDDEDNLLDAGVLHSIHIVELILFVGDTFGITLSSHDVYEGRLASVRGIVDLVSARVGI